jgi:hypothetical protein
LPTLGAGYDDQPPPTMKRQPTGPRMSHRTSITSGRAGGTLGQKLMPCWMAVSISGSVLSRTRTVCRTAQASESRSEACRSPATLVLQRSTPLQRSARGASRCRGAAASSVHQALRQGSRRSGARRKAPRTNANASSDAPAIPLTHQPSIDCSASSRSAQSPLRTQSRWPGIAPPIGASATNTRPKPAGVGLIPLGGRRCWRGRSRAAGRRTR